MSAQRKKQKIFLSTFLNNEKNMQLDHVAIQVKDINRAIEWYKENLGARVHYVDDTWAMLLIGDAANCCWVALVTPSQHPPHIAFRVSSKKELDGEKVKVHRDGSSYIYKADSEGNIIELICWED